MTWRYEQSISSNFSHSVWYMHQNVWWLMCYLYIPGTFKLLWLLLLLGKIALAQAVSPRATHFSVAWYVVCLSVICHTHSPCLNRLMDLHAIWQVHIVFDSGPWPQGEAEILGLNPPAKTCTCLLNDLPGCSTIGDFASYKITVDVLLMLWHFIYWLNRNACHFRLSYHTENQRVDLLTICWILLIYRYKWC